MRSKHQPGPANQGQQPQELRLHPWCLSQRKRVLAPSWPPLLCPCHCAHQTLVLHKVLLRTSCEHCSTSNQMATTVAFPALSKADPSRLNSIAPGVHRPPFFIFLFFFRLLPGHLSNDCGRALSYGSVRLASVAWTHAVTLDQGLTPVGLPSYLVPLYLGIHC